jgi:NAD(P)H-dependent flavin oxidoreductase YrpB (nitropropane dioxygenase family)
MGTRFLASEEAAVHQLYKEKILQAVESDTVYSSLFDIGWPNAPHRVLRNSTVTEWEAAGRPPPSQRPHEGEIVAAFGDGRPIVRYSDVIPLPDTTGDLEALAFYAGQGTGLVSRILPAGEIVRQLFSETIDVLKRDAGLLK